jgi:hypothetical protein
MGNGSSGIMKLSEYDDDSLLEEVKHRGFKISAHLEPLGPGPWAMGLKKITIGGIVFELNE